MAWGTRQKRLRDLLGAQSDLCFQVFAIVTETEIPDERFDKLAAEHGADFENDCECHFPEQKIGQLSFNSGYIGQSERFGRDVCTPSAQVGQIGFYC